MNFVIYGEDKLLMEQRLKTLKKKYHIQEDDMNIVTYVAGITGRPCGR